MIIYLDSFSEDSTIIVSARVRVMARAEFRVIRRVKVRARVRAINPYFVNLPNDSIIQTLLYQTKMDKPKKRKRSRFSDASVSADKKAKAGSGDLLNSKQLEQQILNVEKTLQSIESIKRKSGKSRFAPLVLSKDGKPVDSRGNLLSLPSGPVTTLSINQNPGKSDSKNAGSANQNPYLEHLNAPDEDAEEAEDAFVDESIPMRDRHKRSAATFSFVEHGKYMKIGSKQREREAKKVYQERRKQMDARRHYRQLLGEAGSAGKDAKVEETAVDLDLQNLDEIDRLRIDLGLPTPLDEGNAAEPALMEWWDRDFLPKSIRKALAEGGGDDVRYDYSDLDIKHQQTYKLVEHPTVIKPLVAASRPKPIPLYLTKKERKKKRRQARMEAHQEFQDKVQMGLIPAPKSKVKMSNMMKVLQTQAVAGPSAVAKEVMEGIMERKKDHEMRNLAAKKTPAEKWAKKRQKIQQDSTGATVVAVFKVHNLCSPPERAASLRFKLDVNAQKMALTGTVVAVKAPLDVTHDGKQVLCNVVIVEGGEKRIYKFEKLMKRIKWAQIPKARAKAPESGSEERTAELAAEGEVDAGAKAVDTESKVEITPAERVNAYGLVWKGFTPRPVFGRFHVEQFETGDEAKQWLQSKAVGHYWDMARTKELEGIDAV